MLPRLVVRGPPLFRLLAPYARLYSVAKPAIVDRHGEHSFAQLAGRTDALAGTLHLQPTDDNLVPPRVALLCTRDVSFAVALLSVWRAGLCAVPLGLSYPASELSYFLRQSRAQLLLYSPEFEAVALQLADQVPVRPVTEQDYLADPPAASIDTIVPLLPFTRDPHRAAVIIYTSGTTGRPKGAVLTRRNLEARVSAMQRAWGWMEQDVLLNCLPLHHVHGLENCLLTPLAAGATCRFTPFEPSAVWEQLVGPRATANLFMAVPTMFAKLIAHFEARMTDRAAEVREMCERRFRLMVSGSAALPDPLLLRWKEISGHTLLERYGMTELGMALSNPLHGERQPGHVGRPMPGVQVRIAGGSSGAVVEACEHSARVLGELAPGELLVRGPGVFESYFDNEAATRDAFTPDGWFRTGDTALFDLHADAFRLLGRSSVDILKSGGFKVSALEVERKLLAHPDVAAVAVVGLDDPVWGQKVVAAAVAAPGVAELDVERVREWCKARMPPQEVPAEVRVLKELPLNAMGKVNKKELVAMLQSSGTAP